MTGDDDSRAPGAASSTGPSAGASQRILDQLALFSRRMRGVVDRIDPQLTFVEYSLLGHLESEDGARAHDLARAFGLDKSTISRQLAGLSRRGLVTRDAGHVLRATPAGLALLRSSRAALLDVLEQRLEGWTDAERATFAELLRRYNAAP